MAEAFVPPLNDTWIGIFLWIFAIVAFASFLWFVNYVKNNKDSNLQTSMRILLLFSISAAIVVQMFMLKSRVGII